MDKGKTITLSHIGEFGFIERLRKLFPYVSSEHKVVVGIGDDVAVLDIGKEEYLLATCDAQIGDVHFLVELTSGYDLGLRIAEVNISDIASMGGIPKWALLGLNVPENTSITFLEDFYKGLSEALGKSGAILVGGNLSRTYHEIVIDLFLIGTCKKEELLTRKGASPGDVIVVTGTFGKAKAGLEVIMNKELSSTLDSPSIALARDFYFRPKARLREGTTLSGLGLVKASIDVSDGLLQDIGHLCKENQLDAVIKEQAIPIDPLVKKIATSLGKNPIEWALTGGEDYELLLAVSPEDIEKLLKMYHQHKNLSPLTVIGYFKKGSGKVFVETEKGEMLREEDFSHKGWNHYKKVE